MSPVKLVLLGFGNVGQALARLLLEKAVDLEQLEGLTPLVVGIGTGSHGSVYDPQGLDLASALKLAEADENLAGLPGVREVPHNLSLLRESGAQALLESVPVDYQAGQPAIEYLETALELGMHAVTANKGPVVHAYRRLHELADSRSRRFLFESAVMDGAPIFSLWRECLPGARLVSFRGILNSTTNFILAQMELGHSKAEAIHQAQALGIAETDPSGDIEGWDAAVKVAALATVLMGRPTRIKDVARKGIEDLTEAMVEEATASGSRWKLVCSANDQGEARIAPERLKASDPLYSVTGTSSAVTFESDVLGDLTVTERDPGPHTTAYGMLADLQRALR
jgi:homoserine dehydrogenase